MSYKKLENKKKSIETFSTNTGFLLFLEKSFHMWHIFNKNWKYFHSALQNG